MSRLKHISRDNDSQGEFSSKTKDKKRGREKKRRRGRIEEGRMRPRAKREGEEE